MTEPATRVFPGKRDQIASARDFVRGAARGCRALDEAVLLTSELCTNALVHTASGDGGTFGVTVDHRGGWLRVEVNDGGSPSVPAPQAADGMDEDGRGLAIVGLVADRWGQAGSTRGRSVFFELRCECRSRGGRQGSGQPAGQAFSPPVSPTVSSARLATVIDGAPDGSSGPTNSSSGLRT